MPISKRTGYVLIPEDDTIMSHNKLPGNNPANVDQAHVIMQNNPNQISHETEQKEIMFYDFYGHLPPSYFLCRILDNEKCVNITLNMFAADPLQYFKKGIDMIVIDDAIYYILRSPGIEEYFNTKQLVRLYESIPEQERPKFKMTRMIVRIFLKRKNFFKENTYFKRLWTSDMYDYGIFA
jgi:hypothetical protein